jgi:hypothetical protein
LIRRPRPRAYSTTKRTAPAWYKAGRTALSTFTAAARHGAANVHARGLNLEQREIAMKQIGSTQRVKAGTSKGIAIARRDAFVEAYMAQWMERCGF